MKQRITSSLLKLHQARAFSQKSPYLIQLHRTAYGLMEDMVRDITRPFKNICIHGRFPSFAIPFIQAHNQRFNISPQQTSITFIDHMRDEEAERLYQQGKIKEIRYVDNADSWIYQQECFDLLLTSLRMHHGNSQEELLRKYSRSLKPDGVLTGSTISQGTLSQLYWSYIMAENERYGGMSPKVLQHPSLGVLGSALTMTKYQLVTIVSHNEILQFESIIDLLTLLQQLGESGYLRGRRKGSYKDLLLAASALYTSEFMQENGNIRAGLSLSKFVAWKYHESQPKKLSKGPQVGSVEFADELRKFGEEVESFVIEEGVDDPKKMEK